MLTVIGMGTNSKISFKNTPWWLRIIVAITAFYVAYDTQVVSEMIWGYRHPNPDSQQFLHEHLHHFQDILTWRYSFFLHAAIGSVVLVSGFLSLFMLWIPVSKKAHRNVGKIYITSVLAIAAPTGLVMSFFSRSLFTQINFAFLSLLWFWITLQGYRYARRLEFQNHSVMMTLSFGLTCAALLQRRITFWGEIVAFLVDEKRPDSLYEISAIGGWTTSTLITLILIRVLFKKNPREVFAIGFQKR